MPCQSWPNSGVLWPDFRAHARPSWPILTGVANAGQHWSGSGHHSPKWGQMRQMLPTLIICGPDSANFGRTRPCSVKHAEVDRDSQGKECKFFKSLCPELFAVVLRDVSRVRILHALAASRSPPPPLRGLALRPRGWQAEEGPEVGARGGGRGGGRSRGGSAARRGGLAEGRRGVGALQGAAVRHVGPTAESKPRAEMAR